MKAFWTYTVARFALVAVTYLVLWALARLVGWAVPSLFLLLAAILVSAVVSLFALRGLREQLAGQIEDRARRQAQRVEESREADDLD
jgi:hypothetical protein